MSISNMPRGTQALLSKSQMPSAQQPSNAASPPSAATPQAASAMDREMAIASMRANCELQIEYLQVMTDAVMLAVLQTQSVSILQLATTVNKAKQVSASEAFLDLAIGLAGEGVGSLVENQAKEFFQDFASGILSTNAAFKVLPLAAEGKAMSGDAIDQALAAISGSKEISGAAWSIYSENTRKAIKAGSDKISKALGDAASQQVEKLAPNEPADIAGTDQPGTAITRVVQSYVSAHRLALRTECISLEGFIRSQPSITKEQLSTLTSSFAVAAPPAGMNSLRRELALQMEGLIWAKLYNLEQYGVGNPPVPPGAAGGTGSLPNVPDAITHYWWQRFGPKVAPDTTDPYAKSQKVFTWMVTMQQGMDQMTQQLDLSSSGITPFDPQPWPPAK